MGISYNTSLVRDGLVLHLDAANKKSYTGTGTAWNDMTVNGNNGTLVNGVAYNAANNGSMVFDGVNDYATLPSSPQFAFGTLPFTINIWYKLSTISTYSCLMSIGGSNTPYGGLYTNRFSSNTLLYYGNGIRLQPSVAQVANVWYNLTFIGNTSSIYLNSVLLETSAYTSNFPQQAFVIGANQSAYVECMNGSIPQVQIYNRALTQQEITKNFNATRGRYGV